MKKDKKTKMYMVKKGADENQRRVTSYDEAYGVLRKRGQEMNLYVDVTSIDGLQIFYDIKKEVMPDEKTPIKIFEDEKLYYFVSSDEKSGVIFSDWMDANNLFLNIEKTYDNVTENLEKTRSR